MSLKICGFAVSLVLLLTAAAEGGLTFRQQIRSEGSGNSAAGDMTSKVWLGEDAARIDIEAMAENPMLQAGGYILMRDGEMFFVNPAKETYVRMDPAVLAGLVGAADQALAGAQQSGMTMRFEPGEVEKLLEEDGGEVAGYPTTHYRYHSTFSTTMETPMGSVISDTDSVEDLWTTTAIAFPANLDLEIMDSFAGSALGGKMKEIAEAERIKMTGFPLRRVTVSKGETRATGMMKMGFGMVPDQPPTTTTLEVSEISSEDIPASMFEIPADYAEVEMMAPAGPAMPELNEMDE